MGKNFYLFVPVSLLKDILTVSELSYLSFSLDESCFLTLWLFVVLFGCSVINLSVHSSSTKCNWIPYISICRVVLVLEEQVCTSYNLRYLTIVWNTRWTCFLFNWRFCGKLQYLKLSVSLSSYVVVGWFLSSQKMSCHAQRAVCLSQRPENAGSYAAPRTHQSLSLWKAAQWGFFHKHIST